MHAHVEDSPVSHSNPNPLVLEEFFHFEPCGEVSSGSFWVFQVLAAFFPLFVLVSCFLLMRKFTIASNLRVSFSCHFLSQVFMIVLLVASTLVVFWRKRKIEEMHSTRLQQMLGG
jgi:hypothetical protein